MQEAAGAYSRFRNQRVSLTFSPSRLGPVVLDLVRPDELDLAVVQGADMILSMIDRNMSLGNEVGRLRRERSWSQQELADRSGVSRAEVSAVENVRLSPSIATALALARALGRTVEELFALDGGGGDAAWAFPPRTKSGRFWKARVGVRRLLFPVEPTALGLVPHDGVYHFDSLDPNPGSDYEETVVIAGCDPAVGLLASELRRVDGFASSRSPEAAAMRSRSWSAAWCTPPASTGRPPERVTPTRRSSPGISA